MFLRWMVRPNDSGVDFGLWKSLSPTLLSCPLDVHSGKVARKLGLLSRTQNDAKALMELHQNNEQQLKNFSLKLQILKFFPSNYWVIHR